MYKRQVLDLLIEENLAVGLLGHGMYEEDVMEGMKPVSYTHLYVYKRQVQRRVNSVIELFTARKRLSSVVGQQKDQLLKQAKRILRLNMGMIESLSTAIRCV